MLTSELSASQFGLEKGGLERTLVTENGALI